MFNTSNSSYYNFQVSNKDTAFDIQVPIFNKWKASEKRMLVISQHVTIDDLRNRALFSTQSTTVLSNVMRKARDDCNFYRETINEDPFNGGDWAYAAINFNNYKSYELVGDEYSVAMAEFSNRVNDFIQKIRPTHIFILGDEAAEHMLRDKVTMPWVKRGWVHTVSFGDIKDVLVTSTIDFTDCFRVKDEMGEDDEEAIGLSNLLGFVATNATNLYAEKHIFGLSHIKSNYKLIESWDDWQTLIKRLNESDIIAVDTETENLNRINNKMLMIQFAFDTDTGYILPVEHKETTFNGEQIKEIKRGLRKFFSKRFSKVQTTSYLIMQGGKFDLTVIRQSLGIPVIYWEVYDTMAGSQAIDENAPRYLRKYQRGKDTSYAALGQMFAYYGNDHYFESEFKKSDRSDIANRSLSDIEFLSYCSMDVQSIFGIHNAQHLQASWQKLTNKSYEPHFHKLVVKQLSSTLNVFAQMEHKGVFIDIFNMIELLGKNSPITKLIKEEQEKLSASPNVSLANAKILKEDNIPTDGLFEETFIFDIAKKRHRNALFFDIMKLIPITSGVDGPSTDKNFQEVYAATYSEVHNLSRINKLSRLKSNFVQAFYNKLQENPDSKADHRIRPSYGFIDVVTGRASCRNPSLQQMPTRSKEAKYIKRMFVGSRGKIVIKMDYSAHEVRVWSYVSKDVDLANLFKVGYDLLRRYHTTEDKSLLQEIKLKSDIHKINCNFFFNVDILEVTDDQRAATKAIVFGAIYDKSVRSMAQALKQTEEYVQKLYNKFFGKYKKAKAWLDYFHEFGKKNHYSYSPIGRVRHLHGFMTGVQSLVGAAMRRSVNSPVQGLASDIGFVASRIYTMECHDFYLYAEVMTEDSLELPHCIDTSVHDAAIEEVPYEFLFAAVHIKQWASIAGVTEWYRQVFGVVFTIQPFIDIELGFSQANLLKFDWSISGLKEIVRKVLEDKKRELEPELDVDVEFTKSWNFYCKHKQYLNEKYPYFPEYDYEEALKLKEQGL